MSTRRLFAVSALSLLLTAPAFAQDSDSDDADRPPSRADSSSDPDSNVDRSLRDRARPSERNDADLDRPVVVRDEKKTPAKASPAVRVRLLDIDSELDTDNDDNDRNDNVDRDGQDDEDRPKSKDKKDVAKKDVKKDANKKDDAPKKDAPAKDPGAKKPGDCVDVKAEARFSGVGYDHLVTLKSACKKKMKCAVRTNVSPDAANVTLDPGEEETVLTWRGSPAREFTPDVKCSE